MSWDENGVPQFSDEWKETIKDEDEMHKKYNTSFFLCTTELDEGYTYYSGADEEQQPISPKIQIKIVNYPELAIALPVSTSDMGITEPS